MTKTLAYQRDGYRVWIGGKKVWIEDPSRRTLDLPLHGPRWPARLRRCMGATILKHVAEMQGLPVLVPAEDLVGPDEGVAMVWPANSEERTRMEAGEPFWQVVPAYRISHISVFVGDGRVWLTNGSRERVEIPFNGVDEIPILRRSCFAAAVAEMFSRRHGLNWNIPERNLTGPDGGRAMFVPTADGEDQVFVYAMPDGACMIQ